MKNKGNAAEPTMEEILASVRKSVAEDPEASFPMGAPPQAMVTPAAAPVDPQRTRADLDKDLADLLGGDQAAAPAAADAAAAEAPAQSNGRSGWFFNRSSAAEPAQASAAASQGGRLSETLELARQNIRRATVAASKSPLARSRDKTDAAAGTDSARDLGAVVPARYEGSGQPGRSTPTVTPHGDAKVASAAERVQPPGTTAPAAPGSTPQWGRNPLALTADGAARAAGSAANGHAGATGRSLEDAVAEMLRPMLRDWLDANMPRIMERVMREANVGGKPKT